MGGTPAKHPDNQKEASNALGAGIPHQSGAQAKKSARGRQASEEP